MMDDFDSLDEDLLDEIEQKGFVTHILKILIFISQSSHFSLSECRFGKRKRFGDKNCRRHCRWDAIEGCRWKYARKHTQFPSETESKPLKFGTFLCCCFSWSMHKCSLRSRSCMSSQRGQHKCILCLYTGLPGRNGSSTKSKWWWPYIFVVFFYNRHLTGVHK